MKTTDKTSLPDNGVKNSHKIYQNYTDSEIRWLENIPSSWTEATLSQILRTLESGSRDSYEGEGGILSIGGEHINFVGKLNLENPRFISKEHYSQMNQGKVKTGDALLVKDGATIGKTAYIEESFPYSKAAVNSHVYILGPRDVYQKKFLYYFLFSKFTQQQIDLLITGSAQAGLSRKFAKFVDVPLPPKKDQKAIIKFLDRETSKIDRLIGKEEKLIDLLEEKRNAYISNVFTRGLNRNNKLKDTEAEWLGKIPAHWEVQRLKFLVKDGFKYGANESPKTFQSDLPRYIRITDITEDGKLRENTKKSLSNDLASPYLLEDKDILLARSGATVGKTFLYRKKMGKSCFAGYLIKIRLKQDRLKPELFEYFTDSKNYWEWIDTFLIQSTIENVSAEKYANLIIPVPPLKEQKQILHDLREKTTTLKQANNTIERSIKKLKEYRTALISAAVTGKIDVRGEVE